MRGVSSTVATAALAASGACWALLPIVSSFAPPLRAVPMQGQSLKDHDSGREGSRRTLGTSSPTALFAVPPPKNDKDPTTSLFSTISPGNDEEDQVVASSSNNSNKSNGNSAIDIQTIGAQAAAALVAAFILYSACSFLLDMTTSAAKAITNEIAIELTTLFQNLAYLFGSLLKFLGGMAWEGAKVAAPAVGGALLDGAKVAAPIVQDAAQVAAQQISEVAAPVVQEAAQQISDVAAPVVQEAAQQISEVASPYVNTVSETVGTVSSQAADAISSTVETVSNQATAAVVTPLRDAADAVSNTVDETLAPIKSVGESIKGFRAF